MTLATDDLTVADRNARLRMDRHARSRVNGNALAADCAGSCAGGRAPWDAMADSGSVYSATAHIAIRMARVQPPSSAHGVVRMNRSFA